MGETVGVSLLKFGGAAHRARIALSRAPVDDHDIAFGDLITGRQWWRLIAWAEHGRRRRGTA
jgi:hypothetical protein